jgi:hypothetical protein
MEDDKITLLFPRQLQENTPNPIPLKRIGIWCQKNLFFMKAIPNFNGNYFATVEGSIINKKGIVRKATLDKNRYERISICNGGKKKSHFVHRLICLTYLPNPENKPQVNHKNGIRNDNRLENLEWCTSEEK